MYAHAHLRKTVVLLLGLLMLSTIEIPFGLHTALAVDLSTAIIEVAKKNLPAVVYVEVTGTQEVANPFMPFENDPFFRRFFGYPNVPRKFKQETKGLGSGMILDPEGHILTNYHVAGEATKIEVILSDGSKYPAKLVGGDRKTDLAVIKLSAKERLPHITFGDSDKLEVGEWVVAIGAPRALEKSVTHGIISAKHRRGVTDPSSYEDFLQTEPAINPGNSGGPLLNLRGEVVGVNAAIATQSGGFEGIGFTIPSNMAQFVSKALIAHGKVERGWLGITIQDLTPESAQRVHAGTAKGVLLVEVAKGGPADKAGMKKDDVVIAYQGRSIEGMNQFRNAVAESPVGTTAKVTILRNGKKEELTVTVRSAEASGQVLMAAIKERLGVEVRAPHKVEIDKYDLNPNQEVVITWLDRKGPMKGAGFELRDMILAIDEQQVDSVEGFIGLVNALKPKQKVTILALDHRTGNTDTIELITK